jgi:hypothetical protein
MKKYLLILCVIPVIILLTGCGIDTTNMSSGGVSAQKEQILTEENQRRLLSAQEPPKLDWSLERDNLIKRTTLWNDKNKISYIYLVNYGKVMAFYTIKGKVSSVNSQLTNTEQIVNDPNGDYSAGSVVLPSPSEDGSYGTNGDAVFFFTTEDAYVEWRGDYMLADQPLKLTTQPELIREIK